MSNQLECDICHTMKQASDLTESTFYDYSEGTDVTINMCPEHEGHIGEDAGYSD
jgi:hypothetical protein